MTDAQIALVDNDVLIKLSCFDLIDAFSTLCDRKAIGVLGAARFVVPTYVRRRRTANADAVLETFESFLAAAEELEPTNAEIALATHIEEVATRLSAPFDLGESQLCAIALMRSAPIVITGDKRAIGAAEFLIESIEQLAQLAGRLACLEQLMLALIAQSDVDSNRVKVCAEPVVDKSLTISFSCHSDRTPSEEAVLAGLQSYIRDMRGAAPTLLFNADTLVL